MGDYILGALSPAFIGGWLGAAAVLGIAYYATGRRRAARRSEPTEQKPVGEGFFAGFATSAVGDAVIRLAKGLASLWP